MLFNKKYFVTLLIMIYEYHFTFIEMIKTKNCEKKTFMVQNLSPISGKNSTKNVEKLKHFHIETMLDFCLLKNKIMLIFNCKNCTQKVF